MFDAFSVSVSFGFSSVDPVLECLDMRGYRPNLAFHMVVPYIIALSIVLIAWAHHLCTQRNRKSCAAHAAATVEVVPALLALSFIAYPAVVNKAFEGFSCYNFKESRWLKADVAVQCDSAEYNEVRRLAWAAVFVYPIGLLALTAVLLFSARGAILSSRPTRLSRAIAFLHREYEPQMFAYSSEGSTSTLSCTRQLSGRPTRCPYRKQPFPHAL